MKFFLKITERKNRKVKNLLKKDKKVQQKNFFEIDNMK